MLEISDIEFGLLKTYLRDHTGIDVSETKRYLFEVRLSDILEKYQFSSFGEFYDNLQGCKSDILLVELIDAMTTNVTSFFRDAHVYNHLPDIFDRIRNERMKDNGGMEPVIRILSAGCSTGEEPYSLGICALEWKKSRMELSNVNFSILAGDLSQEMLMRAKQGEYPEEQIKKEVKEGLAREYFVRSHDKYRVSPVVRQLVQFTQLNLSGQFWYLGLFDLIFCRNVIIYFSHDLKKRIVEQFHRMLRPGGALLLGSSESLCTISEEFKVEIVDNVCYNLKKTA